MALYIETDDVVVQPLGAALFDRPRRGLCGRFNVETLTVAEISMGFCESSNALCFVLQGQGLSSASAAVRSSVPPQPGVYIWVVKPPGSHTWTAVYIGKADNLQERILDYANVDGSFGPRQESWKYACMLALQMRGFDIEVRWRGIRDRSASVDEARKLAKYDFALNKSDNVDYRPICVPVSTGGLFSSLAYCRATDFPRIVRPPESARAWINKQCLLDSKISQMHPLLPTVAEEELRNRATRPAENECVIM